MPVPDWSALAASSLAPDRVRRFLDGWRRLPSVDAWLGTVRPSAAKALVAVLGASEPLAECLRRNPTWLAACFSREALAAPRPREALRREIGRFLDLALAHADHAGALRELRCFRQREHVRIAARDLVRAATLEETTRQLSDLADLCLAGALRVARARIASTLGEPWEETGDGGWRPTPFCVIGLGKLGGQELDHGPDLDVLLVYGGEGRVFREPPVAGRSPPPDGPANHQFFGSLAEALVAAACEPAPEGRLFRIDLRCRPGGDAGPLAQSFDAHETHYARSGQTWERMALVKARAVAGDRPLAADFLEMVQAFRYPRLPGEGLPRELAAMQRQPRTVKAGSEPEHDAWCGTGEIHDIEFLVQSLQLLNGGRQPFLQNTSTLAALDKLAEYGLLSRPDARALGEAYRFWREIGHRLQIGHDRAIPAMPESDAGRQRLAALLGFRGTAAFESRREEHRAAVRGLCAAIHEARVPPAAD